MYVVTSSISIQLPREKLEKLSSSILTDGVSIDDLYHLVSAMKNAQIDSKYLIKIHNYSFLPLLRSS